MRSSTIIFRKKKIKPKNPKIHFEKPQSFTLSKSPGRSFTLQEAFSETRGRFSRWFCESSIRLISPVPTKDMHLGGRWWCGQLRRHIQTSHYTSGQVTSCTEAGSSPQPQCALERVQWFSSARGETEDTKPECHAVHLQRAAGGTPNPNSWPILTTGL